MVRTSQYGDWDEMRMILTRMRENHRPTVRAILFENGTAFVDRVRYIVENQFFPGKTAPLSPDWRKRKERLGLDPRVLIASGEYLDSFGVEQPAWNKVVAGPSTAKHSEAQIPNTLLANILEYGREHIPPHPHIRPAWKWAVEFAKKNWKGYNKRVQEGTDVTSTP